MQAYPGRILSIDPGEVHVGVTAWDDLYLWSMEVTPDNIVDIVAEFKPEVLVIESFKMFGAKHQRYSKGETIQLIALIKAEAKKHKAKIFEQDSPLRKIGYRSPYYRRHVAAYGEPKSNHAKDSLAHLIYYINFGKGSK